MYKPRSVSISWLKQRSGNYALKGIRIIEGELAFDSSTAFREEDAIWVTSALGASPDVEVSANNNSMTPIQDNRPEWARDVGLTQKGQTVPTLELERAQATILRYFLEQLIVACDPQSGTEAARKSIAAKASLALQATNTGTHYSLADARAIVDANGPKAPTAKGKK